MLGVHGSLVFHSRRWQDFSFGIALAAEAMWYGALSPYVQVFEKFDPISSCDSALLPAAWHLSRFYEGPLHSFLAMPLHSGFVFKLIEDTPPRSPVPLYNATKDDDDMVLIHALGHNYLREVYVGPSRRIESSNPLVAEAHGLYLAFNKHIRKYPKSLVPLVLREDKQCYNRSTNWLEKKEYVAKATRKTSRVGYEFCHPT